MKRQIAIVTVTRHADDIRIYHKEALFLKQGAQGGHIELSHKAFIQQGRRKIGITVYMSNNYL